MIIPIIGHGHMSLPGHARPWVWLRLWLGHVWSNNLPHEPWFSRIKWLRFWSGAKHAAKHTQAWLNWDDDQLIYRPVRAR